MDFFAYSKKMISQEVPVLKNRSYLSYNQGRTLKKSEGFIKVCVVYANSYFLGMSNLGYLSVCEIFDRQEGVTVDRAFLPAFGQKEVRGLLNGKLLRDFDIVAFSVSYELDFLNIEKILSAGGIDKKNDKKYRPLIVCGGVATVINPYFLKDYVDIVLQGDAELIIPEFIENYKQGNIDDSFDANLKLKKIQKLNECLFSSVITKNTVFSDTILLDGGRGCFYSCKFCFTGNYLKPVLNQDAMAFIEVIDNLKNKGLKKYGIVSSSVGKIKNFSEFLEYAVKNKIKVSVSSLRFEDITEQTLSLLISTGQRQYTLAPETGNYNLRSYVSKAVTDQKIIETVRLIHNKNAFVKLYFMFGLPQETEQDIIDIVKFVKILNSSGDIKVSLQAFVPKPHTPFDKSMFLGEKILKSKKQLLLETAKTIGVPKKIFDISSVLEAEKEWELAWKNNKLI